MRVWSIDARKKKMLVQDVVVGKLRREYTGIIVDSRDEMMYVGTMTGDVLKIRLNCHHDPDIIEQEKQPVMLGCYARHNPKKPIGKDCEKYVFGVRDLLLLRSGNLIIGAGDGTVELVSERNVKMKDYPLPTWPIFTTVSYLSSAIVIMQTFLIQLISVETNESLWSSLNITIPKSRIRFYRY